MSLKRRSLVGSSWSASVRSSYTHISRELFLTDSTIAGIARRQDPKTGTFFGDRYGEPDTRFLYGALNALSLLNLLDLVHVDRAVAYIASCKNPDGGYGTSPGAESHAGQIFVCVAAL